MSRLKLELPELVWLATWPTAWLSRLKKALQEPVRSRALHVLSEAARVRFGAQLLAASQYKRFGVLMYESHESWRRLYDASLPELDLVVQAARRAGALGARATGVGGEVLVLLGRSSATKVERAIRSAFVKAYRREPVITSVQAEGGVRLERV
jgi:galactokinase